MRVLQLCFLLTTAEAFLAPSQRMAFSQIGSALQATAQDAVGYFDLCQSASVNSIATAIPDLASKPDFTWDASSGIDVGGAPVSLDARDAPGPANIAWLSSLTVPSRMSSLTIFNGPLTDVPHLVSRVYVTGDTMHLILDFRARSYGAYEMRREDGSYPGPEELGRKSFEYSGARAEFDRKFGTDEVKDWLSSTVASLEGSSPYDPNAIDLDLLTRGPLYTSVSMPLTDGNVQTVAAARDQAVKYWLSWAMDSGNVHRPGAPVNSQYVYDTKFKQNAYGALLNEYKTVFGADDGSKLAVGDSGPLDEAYVGGGS
mmetsp:Transcript_111615/g.322614  ORF Transcript_111615/g.322614 Transcript_111615/m.322614 type:complete len:314 (-) Transcript_111615:34-975(-)